MRHRIMVRKCGNPIANYAVMNSAPRESESLTTGRFSERLNMYTSVFTPDGNDGEIALIRGGSARPNATTAASTTGNVAVAFTTLRCGVEERNCTPKLGIFELIVTLFWWWRASSSDNNNNTNIFKVDADEPDNFLVRVMCGLD